MAKQHFENLVPWLDGKYRGQGGARFWIVERCNTAYGNWSAIPCDANNREASSPLWAWRLADMSAKLAALPCDIRLTD